MRKHHPGFGHGNKKSKLFLLVLVAIASAATFSCMATQKTCIVAVPPKVNIESPIAVLGFGGPPGYASELSGKIESLLVNSKWKGQSVYEVVDRQHMEKVVREIQTSSGSWMFDPKKVARAGKLAGAKTVIVGKVTRADVDDTYFTQEEKKCIRWKKKSSDLEKVLGLGCEEFESYFIPCVKRKGYFTFNYKVIDVATSRVTHSENTGNESGESKQCNPTKRMRGEASTGDKSADFWRGMFSSTDLGALQDETSAINEAMAKGVSSLAGNISVHTMNAAIKTTCKNESCQKAMDISASYITSEYQLWDKACPVWEAAYQQDPNSYELAYNLGLCAEIRCEYKEANYYYQLAYDNMAGVDQDVIAARDRTLNILKKNM